MTGPAKMRHICTNYTCSENYWSLSIISNFCKLYLFANEFLNKSRKFHLDGISRYKLKLKKDKICVQISPVFAGAVIYIKIYVIEKMAVLF